MFNIGSIIGDALNSLDSVAKETLEDEKVSESATAIRTAKKKKSKIKSLSAKNSSTSLDGLIESSINEINQEVKDDEILEDNLSEDVQNEENDLSDALVISASENEANSEINSQIYASSENSQEKHFRKIIKKKDQEIDRLNAECLDLEDQVSSLKKEVESAWKTYKSSQEQAAERESDLQDEIKMIQKAKQTDKQQLATQIGDAARELEESSRAVKQAHTERDQLQIKIDEMVTFSQEWISREKELLAEIEEAKRSSFSGAQDLQEKLRFAEETLEIVRADHATILRQNNSRLSILETANAELVEALTEKQREVDRMQRALNQAGSEESSGVARELDGLRQQISSLQIQLENERERILATESKARQSECESRALQLAHEDERLRCEETIQKLSNQLSGLQEQIKKQASSSSSSHNNQNNSAEGDTVSLKDKKISEYEEQVKILSTQLLKKQGAVQELQTERSALKARMTDLQNRSAKLEQQLEQLRDPEDDFNDYYYEGNQNMNISRRKSSSSSSNSLEEDGDRYFTKSKGHKVLSGLEQIGVRIKSAPSVAKAVDAIDTWTLLTGKFLRSYPLLRFGFVLYLLILHLWVLVILVVKIESIDSEPIPVGVTNKFVSNHSS